jgi:hypothetical protein
MVSTLSQEIETFGPSVAIEHPAAGLAPFGLLRIAALPYNTLTDLVPANAERYINAVLDAEARMEILRPDLEAALYEAIPHMDRSIRGDLLAVRRAVHNARFCQVSDELRQAVHGFSETGAGLLERWREAGSDAALSYAQAQHYLERELTTHVRSGLRKLSRHPEFLRGLVLASQELYEAIARGEWKGRTERSVLLYLVRAAAKTSPFSVLMHQAVVKIDPASDAEVQCLDPLERTSRSYLNSGVLRVLEQRNVESFRINPNLLWIEDNVVEVAPPQWIKVSGRLWRSEMPARIRLHPVVARLIRGARDEFRTSEFISLLEEMGMTQENAAVLNSNLLEKAIYRPSQILDNTTTTNEMQTMAETVASADAGKRLRLLRTIRAQAPIDGLNLVMEDGGFSRSYGPVGGALGSLLKELAGVLKPLVTLRSHYQALHDLFLQQFGQRGRCSDVSGFLRSASQRLQYGELSWTAEAHRTDGQLRGRAAVTAFVQFALSAKEALVVVNQVHTGCGWLSARHAASDDDAGRDLQSHLARWLRTLKAPHEPVDVPICADCNPLQAHPQLTARSLIWPGEPDLHGNGIPIEQTILAHNAETGLLELRVNDGPAIAPVYLGGTLPSPAWGGRYWLTVLAEPFGIEAPVAPLLPPPNDCGDVDYRARHQEGRVVLSRESWWVKAEHLQRTWFCNQGAKRLVDVARDCRKRGIPRLFFARRGFERTEVIVKDSHKPIWVDTMNPLCLDLLESMLKHSNWFTFSEVLPAADSTWSPFENAPHVSELLVEMAI